MTYSKYGISRGIQSHSSFGNLANVLQIYLNSHSSHSPWPPAHVPCCPATIQLITRSQKVTQLQLKEDLGCAAYNIIQQDISSYYKFWMNEEVGKPQLLHFLHILKIQAISKCVSVHRVALKITQMLTVECGLWTLWHCWHKRAALRYKV